MVIAWLVAWCGLCLLSGAGILRRARYAPAAIWAVILVAMLSALSLLRSGGLDATGILVDVVLFVPLIWFAVWYQSRRRQLG